MAKRTHSSIGDVLNQLRDEFPRHHDLEDPLPREPGSRRSGADAVRLPQVLRGRRRAPAVHPAPAARALPAAEGHQGAARRGRPRRRFHCRRSGRAPAPSGRLDPKTVDALFEETRRAAQSAEARSASAHVRDDDGPEDLAPAESGVSLTRAELVRAAGMTDEDLARLEEYGLVAPSQSTGDRVLFDDDALAVARVCAAFMRHGIEPRHLRMYRAFAEREASLFEQVLLPYRRQRNPRGAGAHDRDARRARRARAPAAHRAVAPDGPAHVQQLT